MAGSIVPQELPIGKDWEEALYRKGCAQMQQEARERLEALEAWLHTQVPPDWRVVGFRERTATPPTPRWRGEGGVGRGHRPAAAVPGWRGEVPLPAG